MKIYQAKRYEFAELNEEAKAHALEIAQREAWENIPEYFLEEDMSFKAAKLLGIEEDYLPRDISVVYSLSYSQGDGASYRGRIFKDQAPALNWPENVRWLEIEGDRRYSHERSFSVRLYDEEDEEIDDKDNAMRDQLTDLSRELGRYGYKWLEDWTSPERVKEELEERDACYTAEGNWSPVTGEVEEVA